MTKISVVLATRNEEGNIGECLDSVKGFADEIIVVDEDSADLTRQIARRYGAKVYRVVHREIFHMTKQEALNRATNEWILQLDADERVTPALAKEIVEVVAMTDTEIKERKFPKAKRRLLMKHQRILEASGRMGVGPVSAFLLPRLNFFLGAPLIYGGVYPDPAIRLVKRGKARFPAKSVHENMEIDGGVAWLFNDLEHRDSPTLFRYLERNNRYTDLIAKEFESAKLPKNWAMLIYYSTLKPLFVFLWYYLRHKAILDGMRGFLWSFFSATRFTIAYFKYWGVDK